VKLVYWIRLRMVTDHTRRSYWRNS